MIKLSTMPMDAAAELLLYLSDHERFSSIEALGDGVTETEVRALLRELGETLGRQADATQKDEVEAIRKSRHLSPKTKNAISYLSPLEEKKLLSRFGLTES